MSLAVGRRVIKSRTNALVLALCFSFLFPSLSVNAQTSSCPLPRSLYVGLQGEDVTCLQKLLQAQGFFSVPATGFFGSATWQAVANFQRANGLPVIGIAGPQTRAKLTTTTTPTTLNPAERLAKLTLMLQEAQSLLAKVSSESSTPPKTTTRHRTGGANPVAGGADLTSPTVSVTAPTANSTVSGSITISATASDNVAVTGVEFKHTTNTLIQDDTASPYSITWDTTAVPDGVYALRAVARDTAGNYATSSAISVTVANDTATSSITQYGITWTFDDSYQYGQFENGDYWVEGPVTIESVSPGWNGTTNGSMVDPVPLEGQGFDSRADYTFDSGNRVTFPLSLNATSSLVSTIGLGSCAAGGAHECLDTAAILTVVDAGVPDNSFRPPYVAGSKPLWNTSDVNYDLLPALPTPDDDLPDLDGVMVRPWLDFGPKVTGATIHPQSNMQAYPRDSSYEASQVAVYVLTDEPDVDEVSNRLIQYGIDLYDISLENENGWEAIGGFGSGRKWPILFAGLMLDSSSMLDVATTTNTPYLNNEKFGEDGHTYYGDPTVEYPGGKPLWGQDCASDGISSPWYGNHDCRDPDGVLEPEQMTNGGGYQECCTSHTWVGAALAAQKMGATSTWDHPAFFDYVDRWVDEPDLWVASSTAFQQDVYGYGGDGDGFMRAMWDTYRDVTAPVLSSANASTTGATIADLYVSTNEGNGTLYWVVTTSSTKPSATQVKTGQNHSGSAAVNSGTQVISSSGTKTASSTGLTAETTYYAHFMHEDVGTNKSTVVTSSLFTTDEADVTAPTLSNPVDTANGENAGTGSVDTNEGNGTLYWVVTQSATSPSATQVKAGQNHAGSAADDSGSQAVPSTGTQTISGGFTGLTAGTTYYAHYMHEDASTNKSSVSSANGFTTDEEAAELATNWAFTGNATGWTLGTGWSFNGANRAQYSSGSVNAKIEQTISVSSNTEYRMLADVMAVSAANGNVIVEVIEQNGSSPQTYSKTVSLSSIGAGRNTIPVIFTTSGDCTSVTISVKPSDNTAAFMLDLISLKRGNELVVDPTFAIHAGGSQSTWNPDSDWDLTSGQAHFNGGGGFDIISLLSYLWLDTSTSYTMRITFSEVSNTTGSVIGRIVSNNNINSTLSSLTPPQTLSGSETPASNSVGLVVFPTSGSANFKITEISLKPTE